MNTHTKKNVGTGSEEMFERPVVLRSGDCIGLIAPSSPFEGDAAKAGIRFLEAKGFRVRHLSGFFNRRKGFLAGEDEQRAEEVRLMFEDPEVKAIFVVRGGYGALRILERLDPEVVTSNPKIFMGYSDVTCLLLFLLEACGLVCFHGPLVNEMGSLTALTERYLLRILTEPEPLGTVPLVDSKWIHKGVAKGRLIGGNLSTLCSTLGTPWEVRTEDRILFLEDRGEKPYRIDRMLVQLKQAGKLSSIRGLLFGSMITERHARYGSGDEAVMNEVLFENTKDLGVPVLCGLPVGHGKENIPLPMGVLAELNGEKNRFAVLEAAGKPGG